MSYADLTSAQWNDLSDSAAGRLAQDIAGRHELTVAGVENRAYAGRSHRTVLFDRGGMRFALVPGGRPALGYDAARFRPAAHQTADYADSAAEFGLPSLTEYVDSMAGLADLGLRTTTPDEWEWACGAGAATLFRWGDDCPGDGYPYDHRTGPHRQENLWGLAIGQDPYRHEATTERTVVCGGDGGGATCGGSGFFLG